MDNKVRNKVAEIQHALEQEEQRLSLSDPVAKMMLVAMAHQSCEIERKIDESTEKLSARLSNDILQHANIQALPAMSIVRIGNSKEVSPYCIDENDFFSCKENNCVYRPLFHSRILPGKIAACMMNDVLIRSGTAPIPATWPDKRHADEVWIAYEPFGEVASLEDVLIALTHPLPTEGLIAEVGDVSVPLSLLLDETPRTLNGNFMLLEYWKKSLAIHNVWIYKFGKCPNKRILHRAEIPAWIRDSYSPEILEPFVGNQYLWIRIKAKTPCALPLNVDLDFNFVPLANYDIKNVKLSENEAVKPLEEGAFFLGEMQNAEQAQLYFIRDFDVSQYDYEQIRDDVTSLYRHFINDYYAFEKIYDLHDGHTLRTLRQSIMQVYDSLDEYKPSEPNQYGGVYAIRNPRNPQPPIVLTYYTTNGEKGNRLTPKSILRSGNVAVGNVEVVIGAYGGRDKVRDLQARNSLARYFANSKDRIFTRMDLMSYCKTEFMRAFGEDAMLYCNVTLSDGNTVVDNHIEKCITINFNFNSDSLREQVRNSDFFNYLEVNIELRKSFSWNIRIK